MGLGHGANIVTQNLILNLDAANSRCYVGSGSSINDISIANQSGSLTTVSTSGNGGSSSFTFNGTDSLMLFASTVLVGVGLTNTLTCEAWIKPTTFGATNIAKIIERRLSTTNSSGFSISINNSITTNGLVFENWVRGNKQSTYVSNVIVTNAWQQVVVQIEPQTRFYVNGELAGIGNTRDFSVSIGASTFIGTNNSSATETFNGSIGIIRFYNRFLGADEIRNNYDATKGRYGL